MSRFNDDELLPLYVGAFDKFNDFETLEKVPTELSAKADVYGSPHWRPIKSHTSPAALDLLYNRLPGRLPQLYERLISEYRWLDVEAGTHRLLGNPPGEDFSGLLHEMQRDSGLWEMLAPNGLVQFARALGGNYDPVCFDTRNRKQNADCRIVQINHEEILCNFRIKEVAEIAPTFRALIHQTLESAARIPVRSQG